MDKDYRHLMINITTNEPWEFSRNLHGTKSYRLDDSFPDCRCLVEYQLRIFRKIHAVLAVNARLIGTL